MRDELKLARMMAKGDPADRKLPVWGAGRTHPKQSGWMNYLYKFQFRKHKGRDPRSFDEDTLN